MVKKSLVLERGDIVWIDFRPTKGHEQSGLRPAVVLSSGRYNSVSGMVLVCPVTSKHKNYFFEVPVGGLEKDSFVLADQIRSFDIKERVLKKAGRISEPELSEVLAKATVLFQ